MDRDNYIIDRNKISFYFYFFLSIQTLIVNKSASTFYINHF